MIIVSYSPYVAVYQAAEKDQQRFALMEAEGTARL